MNIYNLTRDQLPNFSPSASKPGFRVISLDFNHNGHDTKITNAALLAVPEDLTKQEEFFCKMYLELVVLFFKHFGHQVENRGLLKGVGYPGVIHTEPFFTKDKKSLEILLQHSDVYAFILASTLGCIEGSQIILPHKRMGQDMGAVTESGMSEREFARYVIMPHLIREYGESYAEDFAKLFQQNPILAKSDVAPQITFKEI
jgi:hypothetical protein